MPIPVPTPTPTPPRSNPRSFLATRLSDTIRRVERIKAVRATSLKTAILEAK
ncbi:hypothetical protein LguiA_011050 [Lonicera macranthoides]